MTDEATRALLDDLDPQGADKQPGRRRWQIYGPMSAGDRIMWQWRLEQYGPRHDFRYYNDCEFTEKLRAAYNARVTDPALQSVPQEFEEDLRVYDRASWKDDFF